jgi:hypothetical protein
MRRTAQVVGVVLAATTPLWASLAIPRLTSADTGPLASAEILRLDSRIPQHVELPGHPPHAGHLGPTPSPRVSEVPPKVPKAVPPKARETPPPLAYKPPEEAAADPTSRRRVQMSHYCLTGNTASGTPVEDGAVAWGGAPMGSRWQIVAGPPHLIGKIVVVLDRSSRRFAARMDRWVDSCELAIRLGVPWVEVEPA